MIPRRAVQQLLTCRPALACVGTQWDQNSQACSASAADRDSTSQPQSLHQHAGAGWHDRAWGSHQQLRGMAFWGWPSSKKTAAPGANQSLEAGTVGAEGEVPAPGAGGAIWTEDSPSVSVPDSDLAESAQELFNGDSIREACSALEVAAVAASKDESMWTAAQFITGIQTVHESYGLPWWASIVAVNLLTRAATLPIMLASQRATAHMAVLNLELMPVKKLQEAAKLASTVKQQSAIHAAWVKESEGVRIKHGPALAGVMGTMFGTIMLNGLVFISIFNAVNNLMESQAPSLVTGGMYWFTDLTLPDPMYGLPVLCTLTTLGQIQYGMNITGEQIQASPERAGQANRVKNIFRGMALMFLPLGSYVPAGVALLWASNSMFSVVLGAALRQDSIRKMVGLPSTKELADVAERLQALSTKDPLSFVPDSPQPTPATPPFPSPTDSAAQSNQQPPPPGTAPRS